ncbi:hypothetical protein A0J61_06516 [Choanephora cucurbitarum]|uniref:Uncharacterized protein n=1 Tax=Choanephora cucurbitarum TaxID=101091 RepID=A0A1C7N8H4_9FUNG|nr:hypothetical protein A0J61_06516 [Choanephora cucurbitarum]
MTRRLRQVPQFSDNQHSKNANAVKKLPTAQKNTISGVKTETATIVVGTTGNKQVAEAEMEDMIWSHPWLQYFKKFRN